MKIIMPDFVLPSVAEQTCALLETCDFVTINSEGQLSGEIAGAEVFMLPWQLAPEMLQTILALPTLRWVHTMSAGVDHALNALRDQEGLLITNASGVFDIPIAETVLGYMLAIVKRFPEFLTQQQARQWQLLRLRELRGLTVGIVGLGSIGQEIAQRCQALGMRVYATRRHAERGAAHVDVLLSNEALPELLAASDFVVLAVPLTAETTGLIGAAELQQMSADAWLINIARGAVVDEAALIAALQSGEIGGAALDVFATEPLPPDSALWTLPNVIITPHNAWSTPHARDRQAQLFLDNLSRYLENQPLRNVIDLQRGY